MKMTGRRSRFGDNALVSRKHRPDYQIVLFMGLLVLIGVIVLYAISPARVEMINTTASSSLDQAHFMQKQLLYLAVGLAAFIGASLVPLEIWKKYTNKVLLAGFLSCAILAFLSLFLKDGLIINTGGAVRWFNLGVASFQPAELLKFGVLLFTAGFLARRTKDGSLNNLKETLLPIGVVAAASAFFIVILQKDMGTGITMLGIILAMIVFSGMRWRNVGVAVGTIAAAGMAMIIIAPHRVARVLTFLNPSDVSDTASYHINQALIALGSGGFFGKGLGNSVQAFGYLPEAVNDSIFAILGETFGFIGVLVIIVIFFGLLRRVLMVFNRTVDIHARLLVAGVFGLIVTHVVVNIGAMTGVFPLTGVTLPFLSFGGTSLLFTMIALGMVLHISRYTTHRAINPNELEAADENSGSRRRVGRTRYTGSRGYQRSR